MGFMTAFFNQEPAGKIATTSEKSLVNDGSHAINKDEVLSTGGQASTPMTPGKFSTYHTVPEPKDPRYYTPAEAQALKHLAKQKKTEAKSTKVAVKSQKSIRSSDTTVHRLHNELRGHNAKKEAQQVGSNANLASELHGLRADYALFGQQVQVAEQSATNAINAIKATL